VTIRTMRFAKDADSNSTEECWTWMAFATIVRERELPTSSGSSLLRMVEKSVYERHSRREENLTKEPR
jgi:hypothetical protein